jgi:lipid II:glycine glycyltransferase (peptidoglycan interpeptide bridge formation enzyme)
MNTLTIKTEELTLPASGVKLEELRQFFDCEQSVHYAQSLAWLDVLETQNTRLFISRNSRQKIVASSILSIVKGRFSRLSSLRIVRGPVAKDAQTAALHLQQLLPLVRNNGHSLIVNPFVSGALASSYAGELLRNGFQILKKPNQFSDTLIVPILSSSKEQWNSLRRSTRTAINKLNKAGAEINLLREASDYDSFSRKFSKFASERGISSLSQRMAFKIFTAFANSDRQPAVLLSANWNGSSIGQILLMPITGSLIYEWGWLADPVARDKLPVMHSLLFFAIGICRDNGLKELDLGGYWMDRGADDPINQFKLGFTKDVRHYLPEYEYIISPSKYRIHNFLQNLYMALT